ncbi:carbohydrate ABC transporter permease [Actinopolymorpha pittospori]|uniref:Multiple sugar transport system permease protein n=1 Tax=Actinopolymorpha pittospori TaxID=648752 RepID=A0A927MUF1_9ACTN|nr:sugar ABC transporter permease [Actinopolymorpha pittospori]MBE1607086.1 multiple sugar transport system permease protein [Actinopolymorpha pittospori]
MAVTATRTDPTGRPGSPPVTGPPPWHQRNRARDLLAAAAFLTPNVALYCLFIVVPTVTGIVLGFYDWNMFDPPRFVGAANYLQLVHDPEMLVALKNTIVYLVLGVVPTVLIGFMLAVLVNTNLRGVGVIRVAYFMPVVVSAAVSAVLWSWLYQPGVGVINLVLSKVGIQGPAWLVDTTWALPALTLMLIWLALPIVIILYLAALQRIPESVYEAAKIDGAGMWARLWRITWPNVSTGTLLVLALQFVNFMGAPFEVSLIMTDGGPLGSTEALSLYIYKVAFEQADVGYAAALSMVQFLIIVVVAGGLRLTNRLVSLRRAR